MANAVSAAVLVNLVGFLLGAVLYGLLLVMAAGSSTVRGATRAAPSGRGTPASRLVLATGVLGLLWNLGAFLAYGFPSPAGGAYLPILLVASFTALGFLPAVVVHSVLSAEDEPRARTSMLIVWLAYGLSTFASLMHVKAAATGSVPSPAGLTILTGGFAVLMLALLVSTRARRREGRAIWVVALSVFAVSALHLARHEGGESWWTEAIGHHASLPLALAILHRDYRFALADIFLKRALTLTLVVAVALAIHLSLGLPWLTFGLREAPGGVPLTVSLLVIVIAAALMHDTLRRSASWFVDRVVLRRPDYHALSAGILRETAGSDEESAAVRNALERLGRAMDASWFDVLTLDAGLTGRVTAGTAVSGPAAADVAATLRLSGAYAMRAPHPPQVIVAVPTVDPPTYVWLFGELLGGRRVLSDDLALVESAASGVGRRIDSLRVARERWETTVREQQISRLATEAELRALRAQLNPHFLFNALTTIGYLITTSPPRAQETLLRLTSVLRGVLRRTTAEFTTLGEEVDLVRAYLEIEQARFEERLRVSIDVPAALRNVRVPSLLLQPLVENAIKHGIAPSAAGGTVTLAAGLEHEGNEGSRHVRITIADTGVGASASSLTRGRVGGLGISSVERRLQAHYGDGASLDVQTAVDGGTRVELTLPLDGSPPTIAGYASDTVH